MLPTLMVLFFQEGLESALAQRGCSVQLVIQLHEVLPGGHDPFAAISLTGQPTTTTVTILTCHHLSYLCPPACSPLYMTVWLPVG